MAHARPEVSSAAIVKTDGVFEAVLGLVLVVGAAAGLFDANDFPSPVGALVVAALGCALVAVGVVLWGLAGGGRVDRSLLVVLAAANAATAALAVACLLAVDGFSAAGSAVMVATAVALVALAVTQLVHAARG